jgi:hypothetical protein
MPRAAPAIADMEDLSNTVFQPSVSPIGADGEQRDRVLIIGNDVVQLSAECSPDNSRTRPKNPGTRPTPPCPASHSTGEPSPPSSASQESAAAAHPSAGQNLPVIMRPAAPWECRDSLGRLRTTWALHGSDRDLERNRSSWPQPRQAAPSGPPSRRPGVDSVVDEHEPHRPVPWPRFGKLVPGLEDPGHSDNGGG